MQCVDSTRSLASGRHRSTGYCSFVRSTSGKLFASLDFLATWPQLLKLLPRIQAEETIWSISATFKFGLRMLLWSRHQLSGFHSKSTHIKLASCLNLRSSSTFSWLRFQGSQY